MNKVIQLENNEIEGVAGGILPIVAFGLDFALTFTGTTALIASEMAENGR